MTPAVEADEEARRVSENDVVAASPAMLCEQIYQGLLGRGADPAGLADVVALLRDQGAHCIGTVLHGVLGSAEFGSRWRTRFGRDAFLRPDGDDDLLVLDLSDRSAKRSLGAGWHASEPSWTWASGRHSVLQGDAPGWDDDATLFLEIATAGHPALRPEQRLDVAVNGIGVGSFRIGHRHPCTLVCHVPGAALRDKAGLTVTIDHPDGFVPADLPGGSVDGRNLSFALRELRLERLTPERRARRAQIEAGLARPVATSRSRPQPDPTRDLAALAGGFESLGSNCELGFVQRAAGSESVSLLRFSGLPLHKLLRGLRTGFAGLGEPGRFHMDANPVQADYLGRDDVYLLDYHTAQPQGSIDPQRLLAQETARVRFLARKLLEDVEEAAKILVVKADVGLAAEQIASLLELISARGRSILLWIDLASPAHPAGTVDVLCPGLMRGYVDRFGDLDVGTHTISHECWHAVLRHADALRELAAR